MKIDPNMFIAKKYYNELYDEFIAKSYNKDEIFIQISHTDMDGLASVAIPDIIFEHVEIINPAMCGMFRYATKYYCQQPSQLGDTVKGVLQTYNTVYGNRKRIWMLITDLGGFDPEWIEEYRRQGMWISFLYVDHHKSEAYKDMFTNFDRFNTKNKTTGELSLIWVDSFYSATMWVGQLFLTALVRNYKYTFYSDRHSKRYVNGDSISQLLQYLEDVTTYDTGKWRSWSKAAIFTDLPSEVRQQIIFSSIVKLNGTQAEKKDSYRNYIEYITRTILCKEITFNDLVHWGNTLDKLDLDLDRLKKDVEILNDDTMVVAIKEGKINFLHNHNVNPELMKILDSFTYPNNMNGYIGMVHTNAVKSLSNFSFASRELFDIRHTIKFAINLYPKLNKVELRSATNGPDMSEMARANAGGGHIHAAGFPCQF